VDPLLATATALLNRGIQTSATARGLVTELDGRRLAMVMDPPGTRVVLTATDGRLIAGLSAEDEADAELRGGPIGFARLQLGDPQSVLRSGAVRISGDTETAERFQALLESARPDPEEELAKVIGDVPAHQLGEAARGLAGWTRTAAESFARSLSEYLREERRDLPTRSEIDAHLDAVDEFAAAVDRAEARLKLLRDEQADTA
jgi:ubiquinone biosynthesis protein UbiJ